MVSSVKQALRQLELPKQPSDEDLRNFLSRAEYMINTRPLTDVPLETDECEALTPNHFLIGSSNGRRGEAQELDVHKMRHEQQSALRQFWKKWIAE